MTKTDAGSEDTFEHETKINILILDFMARISRSRPRPHCAEGILKPEVLLWKSIKCFASTLHRRNLNTEVLL